MRNKPPLYFGDFKCITCRNHVSSDSFLSGVHNRNHCPYCLHSRHLDLYKPGDRLSACKGRMEPVGLALKKTNKKYGNRLGELMLIHRCADCEKFSINRIAADDIPDKVYEIFKQSLRLDQQSDSCLNQDGIRMLRSQDEAIVRARLFGWSGLSGFETEQKVMEFSFAD